MSRRFSADIQQVGADLTTIAGSYLHTVVAGDWQACRTCALPLKGHDRCPQCAAHLRSGLPLADRTGFLVYADKPNSQAYRTMFGYKEDRLRSQYEPVVRGLLAVGLRAHFVCANLLAGTTDSGWAVVPSTRGRSAFADLVHGLSRTPRAEVAIRFTGVAPDRGLNPKSWEVTALAPLPMHVLVVDDSWVSGSSAQSLAVALKTAGVGQVSIISLARVLSPDWEPNKAFIKSVLPRLPYDWKVCPWTGGACPDNVSVT